MHPPISLGSSLIASLLVSAGDSQLSQRCSQGWHSLCIYLSIHSHRLVHLPLSRGNCISWIAASCGLSAVRPAGLGAAVAAAWCCSSMLSNHLAAGACCDADRAGKELCYKMQVQPQNGWLLLLVVEDNTPPHMSIPNMYVQRAAHDHINALTGGNVHNLLILVHRGSCSCCRAAQSDTLRMHAGCVAPVLTRA